MGLFMKQTYAIVGIWPSYYKIDVRSYWTWTVETCPIYYYFQEHMGLSSSVSCHSMAGY